MKFWSLFRKELRELLTVGAVVGILVEVVLFVLLGQFMGNVSDGIEDQMGSVVLADLDGSELSASLPALLEDAGMQVISVPESTDALEIAEVARENEHTAALVIPAGFGAGIAAGQTQTLQIITRLDSFSLISGMDPSASSAAELISTVLSAELLETAAPGSDPLFLKNPVLSADTTVANGHSASVNASLLQQFAMQQTIFIPLIVFILITFSSQLNASAIANEKGDKTLETLLSAPVSRVAVLGSKMCASGVLSLLMAAAFLFGFSFYMGGMSGAAEGSADIAPVLQQLGLQLGPVQYLLLGLQMFLTIMIALAVSMVLGALAKDLKAASSLLMPMMLLAMAPYLVTMLLDVRELPLAVQILLYLIPFTHTFTASANLLFGNMLLFWIGVAYQALVLFATMSFAVHIFSTDRIFTLTLDLNQKKRRKKGPAVES